MKTPDYLSYERYKKKKESNPNRRLLIFITTFFATLLLFSVVAKSLSPDVDVTIGEETETDAKETGLGVKRFIDDRLKMIQMEDSSVGVSTSKEGYEAPKEDSQENIYKEVRPGTPDVQEEKLSLPTKGNKTDNNSVMPAYNPPRPSGNELSKPFETPKMTKVYVGRYSTVEQAKVAQEILMDSGLNVTPFIKDMGGTYTLQIGSFSSRAKAEEISSELRGNGFPARIIQE